jgi:two-component system cell cycle sensor histidine kinase/response regulator CckA
VDEGFISAHARSVLYTLPMNRSELLPFRAVFFEAADAMLILDDERLVVDANRAACALFRVPGDAIRSRHLDSLVVDEAEAIAAAWRELMALGEAKREHQIRFGDDVRIVECSYRAEVHAHRHLCIARDITERRALEARVAQSEKIESVGRLAGGIAHDFNNLLTAILGYTELLIGNKPEGDPELGDLHEIQRAGQRAAVLTQQLLAFGRKQVLLPRDVDLNEIVKSVQTMLARLIREDVTLTCTPAPEPAIVRVDAAQFEQVIVNLVLNARDALPSSGGHIRIEVARVPRARVDLTPDPHVRAAEYIRLRVIDDGIGISSEARAHLFEPFFTTKQLGKGNGLGLASVYGIVRQSNGSITVESELGKGATFTIHLPAAAPKRQVLTGSGERLAVVNGCETILLVEDEDSVRVIVAAVLRRHGYNVLEASTPSCAMELFEPRRREIDLLLTDVVMPEMNGPALARRLLAQRPDLAVLFISGYADVSLEITDDNPAMGFLSKPFQASTLVGRVSGLLAARPTQAV